MERNNDKQLSIDDFAGSDMPATKRARKKKTAEIVEEVQEKILEAEYSELMRKSYLDYSMSVITSRALPDARDGLKPVHRRIIYDMSELGTTSDKPYRKVARVVGDTMGKFHPHGDSSIEDALVVMAQDWKKMVPMVDGHGNFGSIEGDSHAAARYIECRLSGYSELTFLSELKEDTVDFVPNYSEEILEPSVLPCRLPNLLINGAEGIAVGMATSIPTHNTGEVIDGAVYYLDNEKKATLDGLMEFVSGPDFPTGGIIANKSEIRSIYETGIGKLKVRGKVETEHLKGGKDRLVITEIPFTMIGDGIQKFLQSVAGLVEDKTLPDIVDILNQSSKEGIRIVLELRKGADTEQITNILYKKTRLEDTFGCNFLAISHGKPETMSLLDIYRDFTEFQYEINTRKFKSLLKKAEKKAEIDEGLLKAIDVVDTIVEILRGSKNVSQAKACLMTGKTEGISFKTKTAEKQAAKLRFTEIQAQSILELRLSRLVGLELDAIQEDYDKITKAIGRYRKLLASKAEMKKEIKKGLLDLKSKYAVPRKTVLTDAKDIVIKEKPEEIIPLAILIDRFHYIHAIDESVYEKNKETVEGGEYRHIFHVKSDDRLVVITDTGKAHIIKVKDIPLGKLKDRGVPIDNISGYDSKTEAAVSIMPLIPEEEIIIVATDGYVKHIPMSDYDVSRKSVDATKLTEGAGILFVGPYQEKKSLQLVSEQGMGIRFLQSEIPLQSRSAKGVIGLKLAGGDKLIEATDDGKMRLSRRGGSGKKR